MNEKVRRRLAAAEAKSVGWGGMKLVSGATQLSYPTIRRGLQELDEEDEIPDRTRRAGGGRKPLVEKDHSLMSDLERIVKPHIRGDPQSPLLWSSKSGGKVARQLQQLGHLVSVSTVRRLFRKLKISLQALRKRMEGSEHPDRDAQFEYIFFRIEKQIASGNPVISTDSKKTELIGPFKNNGREWRPKGEPESVNVYDYPHLAEAKAIPDGVYDIGANKGYVNIGTSRNTAAFNAETIRRWWYRIGKNKYPNASSLLIVSDAGGSNGYLSWLWKEQLQQLAKETGIPIHTCHYPSGTSKWNPIEHRMFSYIATNWRGKPLTSLEILKNYITATTTTKGLTIQSDIDTNKYETGLTVTKMNRAKIRLVRDGFLSNWNYKIRPVHG